MKSYIRKLFLKKIITILVKKQLILAAFKLRKEVTFFSLA